MRTAAAVFCTLLSTCATYAQSPDAGSRQYEFACSRCHARAFLVGAGVIAGPN